MKWTMKPVLLCCALAVLVACRKDDREAVRHNDPQMRIPAEDGAPEPAPSGYGAAYLVRNADFINWVRAAALQTLKVRGQWYGQIGTAGMNALRSDLAGAGTDAAVRTVIRKHRIDTVETDNWLAEHLVSGIAFRQRNDWLFQLSESSRNALIREAFFAGLTSTDERWVRLRGEIEGAVEAGTPALAQYKIDAFDVWECTYATLVTIIKSAAGFATLVDAVNDGNWNATVYAVKQLLRGARRWGWVGVAWAAIDIATCLWGRY